MGHRTLVAYEREDGTYNVHYSHWGGSPDLPLYDGITKTAPFGGDDLEPEFVTGLLAALNDGFEDMEVAGYLADSQQTTAVEPEPEAVGVELGEVAEDMLDFLHHEAFYVVNRVFEVEPFRTWRLIPPEGGEPFERDVGNGVLVRPAMGEDGRPRSLTHHEAKYSGYSGAARSIMAANVMDRDAANTWLIRVARTIADEANYYIPPFSPFGHPAGNRRENGVLSPVPFPKDAKRPSP